MSNFKKGTLVVVVEHESMFPDQGARLGQQGVVVDEYMFPNVQFADGAVLAFNPCKLRVVSECEPPEEFYFVASASRPGAVYHAAKTPEGDYRVSWSLALGHKGTGSNLYSYNEVRSYLRSKYSTPCWEIVEAPAAPEPTLDERIADAVVAVIDATRARNDQSCRHRAAADALDLERRALEKARNAQEEAELALSKLLHLKAQQS